MKTSVHTGYLLKRVNAAKHLLFSDPPKEDIRFVGTGGIRAEEQDEFDALGKMLVKRLTKSQNFQDMPALFAVLDLAAPNAYAIWPAKCYGVLPTAGLISRLQRICGQTSAYMTQRFADGQADDALVKAWKDLPRDDEHLVALGGLLANIAFSFIVHHELAHIGLGHEKIMPPTAKASNLPVGAGWEESEGFIDERAVLEATDGSDRNLDPDDALSRHAIETDADINGFIFTLQKLENDAARFSDPDVEHIPGKEAMRAVWSQLLNNQDALHFVALAGAFIALLSFVRTDTSLENLRSGTHPTPAVRMIALLHFDAQLIQAGKEKIEPCIDALLFSAGLYGFILLVSERARAAGNTEDNLKIRLERITLNSILSGSGLSEAADNLNVIADHYAMLAARMKTLHPKREHYRRMDSYLRHIWF